MRKVAADQRIQLQLELAELARLARRAAQRLMDHACTHGDVAQAIDKDHAARHRVLLVFIQHHRFVEGHFHEADAVQRQRLGGALLQRVDLDLMNNLFHAAARLFAAILIS